MKENKEIKKLEDIKYLLKEKGRIIVNSKIKQNKLEEELIKLKSTKNNIMNNRKKLLIKILNFIVYDIIMLFILISFVSNIISNFTLTPLLITGIYAGVLSISIIGAYISSVIEAKIKKYYNNKRLNIISNKIKTKEEELVNIKELISNLEEEIKAIKVRINILDDNNEEYTRQLALLKGEVFAKIIEIPNAEIESKPLIKSRKNKQGE